MSSVSIRVHQRYTNGGMWVSILFFDGLNKVVRVAKNLMQASPGATVLAYGPVNGIQWDHVLSQHHMVCMASVWYSIHSVYEYGHMCHLLGCIPYTLEL